MGAATQEMSNAFLPSHLTVDAVPEKRTADEEDQPRDDSQGQEYLRRLEEDVLGAASCGAEAGECRNQSTEAENVGEENSSKGNPKVEPECPRPKKKTRDKEGKPKKTKNNGNVINITGCTSFHIGNTNQVTYNCSINGDPTRGKVPTSSQKDDKGSTPPAMTEKLFHCLDPVSIEDCAIVSEHVTCNWKALGEHLFDQDSAQFEEYIPPIEGKSNKQGARLILEKWKKVNGKFADVRKLSKVLQKLNEYKAIIKLAKRHGIE